MSTAVDSFDASPLDAFVKSPLDARNSPGGRALFWWGPEGLDFPSPTDPFTTFIKSIGFEVDHNSTFDGSIAEYSVIYLTTSATGPLFPPWWEQFDSWSGRLLFRPSNSAAAPNPGYAQHANALSPKTGITTGSLLNLGDAVTVIGVLPHPLTDGMATGLAFSLGGNLLNGGIPLTGTIAASTRHLVVNDFFPGRAAPLSVVASSFMTAITSPITNPNAGNQGLRSSCEQFFKNVFQLPVGA